MSWSIYVQGEAQKVCDSLDSFNAYPNNGPESQEQIDQAKKIIRDEIGEMVSAAMTKATAAQHPSDKGAPPLNVPPVFVSVQASGHHDGDGFRNLDIKVSTLNLLV